MNFTLLLQGFCAKLFTKYTYLLPFPFYVDELLLFTYAGIVVGLFSLFTSVFPALLLFLLLTLLLCCYGTAD